MRWSCKWFVLSAIAILFASNAKATEVLDTDIVVVGGGLSGLSAGLTAVEKGAKVVIFEKLPGVGGAGNYPEGSLGVGTRLQKKLGYTKTVDEVFAKGVEFHHWRVNASVLHTLIANSGRTIDWIEDQGITFRGIKTMYPPEKSLGTWHLYTGGAAAVVKKLYKNFVAKGGTLYTETTVKNLLTDNSGKVTGVVAQSVDGKTYVVNAKGGVILATGGFESNKEMLKKYVADINAEGMLERVMYRGPLIDGRTGDGINMAVQVGAKLDGMGTLAGNSPYLDNEPPIYQFNGADHLKQMRCALSQPFLWINKSGQRFYNESAGSAFTDVYNAMTANGGLMYNIFDEHMKNRLVSEGPYTPFNAIVQVGQKMTALNEGLEKGIKEGYAFKADTLEELAAKIKVDPEALKATVSKINSYAGLKKDPDFGRKPEHLFKFSSTGPYYALKGIRAFFLTLGGVKINDNMQAINTNGAVIPGLYVTGQDMGGLYDSSYDLLLEGSASGFALVSGKLAAEHIVKTKLSK
ncbi:FAD-dependent oxidoreductase [Oryzomonas sagensis]|uniref:FAD-dependent oxidoreductase n=1 Tax=Oryzomonas sagensis TaxID=2603857 RepID=A0ABQ6TRG2_9BACT|nr:FAD-dependent oxidoreductase [Oryzomonas sagensis]KAB0671500.1 FAD-dependent oxidoreductase [Oryzomonas sagensis]